MKWKLKLPEIEIVNFTFLFMGIFLGIPEVSEHVPYQANRFVNKCFVNTTY